MHLEKAKGTDSRMSAHIERTVHPKNADRTRTHLNRELVQFPEGVRNRTQAIAHRVETAGIRRKVGTNQVRAIRVLLTGSNRDMKQIGTDDLTIGATTACNGSGKHTGNRTSYRQSCIWTRRHRTYTPQSYR